MKNDIDLDLDSLAPTPLVIAHQGKEISVNPLNIKQYATLVSLGMRIQTSVEQEMTEVYGKIDELIKEVVPDLKDVVLHPGQLMQLFAKIAQANTPTDKAIAELEKRGVALKGGDGGPKASTS